ncbi:RBPJ-interacting and tubulin-associated protein 1-like isoform X1 [Chiloscyllium punctatum]|uniref:RBPJ-interacting and tubulin-associated protein 1-like isoform X1 n=2 Tax=Chiloscyllium punctatum TaxID=137246 RepID=UPI003B634D89
MIFQAPLVWLSLHDLLQLCWEIDFIFEKSKSDCQNPSPGVGMSADKAINAVQHSHVRHKGFNHYRVIAKTSYVDETLFGKSYGLRSPVAELESPWHSTSQTGAQQPSLWSSSSQIKPSAHGEVGLVPNPRKCGGTPIKKNKYRLKGHVPSYCDESLFGPKQEDPNWEAPWTAQEDKIKIRPLLWSPSVHNVSSNAFCSCSSQFSSAKGNPVKPLYLVTRESSTDAIAENRGKSDYWKQPKSDEHSTNSTPILEQSKSLVRKSSPWKRIVKTDFVKAKLNTTRNTEQLQCRPISPFTGFSGPKHCNKQKAGKLSDYVSYSQPKVTDSVMLGPPWKY